MTLAERIRKAREQGVEIGGHQFMVRRPTDEEAAAISAHGDGLLVVVKRFTIGWNLNEIDIVPGGNPLPAPFDPETFGEWVADRPDVWEPLGAAIVNAYKAHAERREAAIKN
jgi:hypothetical protein